MTALPLFELDPVGNARRRDPSTSRDAARAAAERLPSLRARILDALARRPMTDDDLCRALGEHPRRWPSVKTARSALSKQEPPRVVWAGVVSGGQRVWKLAEADS